VKSQIDRRLGALLRVAIGGYSLFPLALVQATSTTLQHERHLGDSGRRRQDDPSRPHVKPGLSEASGRAAQRSGLWLVQSSECFISAYTRLLVRRENGGRSDSVTRGVPGRVKCLDGPLHGPFRASMVQLLYSFTLCLTLFLFGDCDCFPSTIS
jgi:hypothetical protein